MHSNETVVLALMVGLGILASCTLGVGLGQLFDWIWRRFTK